ADTDDQALEIQWPYYKEQFEWAARERGWRPPTYEQFIDEVDHGSMYVGSPETVANRIAATMKALSLSRFDLLYAVGRIPHDRRRRTPRRRHRPRRPHAPLPRAPARSVRGQDPHRCDELLAARGRRRSRAHGCTRRHQHDRARAFPLSASGQEPQPTRLPPTRRKPAPQGSTRPHRDRRSRRRPARGQKGHAAPRPARVRPHRRRPIEQRLGVGTRRLTNRRHLQRRPTLEARLTLNPVPARPAVPPRGLGKS